MENTREKEKGDDNDVYSLFFEKTLVRLCICIFFCTFARFCAYAQPRMCVYGIDDRLVKKFF